MPYFIYRRFLLVIKLIHYTIIRNRIIWQREGRSAKANWENVTEDICFDTKDEDSYFNVDTVKQKRKVLAHTQKTESRKIGRNQKIVILG